MSASDTGRIAARAIGVLLIVIGLVILIDFVILSQQTKDSLQDAGWTGYSPMATDNGDDASSEVSFFHDAYYMVATPVSPVGAGVLIFTGIAFFCFSRPLGRLIGGRT